jgi:hypothetical protein
MVGVVVLGESVGHVGKGICSLAVHMNNKLTNNIWQAKLTGWLADLLPEGHWPVLARSIGQQGFALSATATGLNVDSPLFEPSVLELGAVTARAKVFKNAAGMLASSAGGNTLRFRRCCSC